MLSHDHGWRAACTAGCMTDLGVGSSDWLGSGIFKALAFIASHSAQLGHSTQSQSVVSDLSLRPRRENQSLRVIRLGPSTHPSQSSRAHSRGPLPTTPRTAPSNHASLKTPESPTLKTTRQSVLQNCSSKLHILKHT